ncbi:hypothetical protein [Actinoplanes solisilvae]|uniref:MmyB family transcriptional regulator n=1 Tax=Actinoplanes solisilvae TaxID=2486853 RepID=UPI000FDC87CB|nr:hypothetical protein [Actinoplanes solisilvae]
MHKRANFPVRLNHPRVGELTPNCERLVIAGTDSLALVVYHPVIGSADAEKLSLLASVDLPTAAPATRSGNTELLG